MVWDAVTLELAVWDAVSLGLAVDVWVTEVVDDGVCVQVLEIV
jgi:hypothetical protein